MLTDPPWYLPWAVILVSLIVLAWAFWEKEEAGEDVKSTQSCKSHGPYSPTVLGNGNQFHYHSPTVEKPPVAPPQITAAERIEQYGRYVDGLSRALGASGAQYKSTPQPDVPMPYFLGRVYKKCGKPPEDGRLKSAYYKRVDREIQDAVVLNKLSTWGYYADTAIRPIGCHVWQNAVLDHRKKTLSIPSDAVRPMVMKDLRFNKEQVDDIWPE